MGACVSDSEVVADSKNNRAEDRMKTSLEDVL